MSGPCIKNTYACSLGGSRGLNKVGNASIHLAITTNESLNPGFSWLFTLIFHLRFSWFLKKKCETKICITPVNFIFLDFKGSCVYFWNPRSLYDQGVSLNSAITDGNLETNLNVSFISTRENQRVFLRFVTYFLRSILTVIKIPFKKLKSRLKIDVL